MTPSAIADRNSLARASCADNGGEGDRHPLRPGCRLDLDVSSMALLASPRDRGRHGSRLRQALLNSGNGASRGA